MMTLLSKCVRPLGFAAIRRKNVAVQILSTNSRKRLGLSVANVRYFRWDGRPDNVFGHSFKSGVQSSEYFWYLGILTCALFYPFINWKYVKEITGLDKYIKDGFWAERAKYLGNLKATPTKDEIPSSLVGDVYDKYGEKGVDSMVEVWKESKASETALDPAKLHSMMMAKAAANYASEVAKQAKQLELDQDPEVKAMVEKMEGTLGSNGEEISKGDESGEVNNFAAGFLQKITVKAEENLSEDGEDSDEKKSDKVGFRERKIVEYENRIRQYSTPDKVFRYFATYKVVDGDHNHEVMMTPQDFLRSISPGVMQPEGLGLDQYMHVSVGDLDGLISQRLDLPPESIFYQLGAGGLISFSDYIFLLTVLSTSRRHFQIAFKMFDLNGDGNVDAAEFEIVTNLMRSHSSTGARHRDHGNTGSTFKGINSGLNNYFFGEEKKGTLTVERFLLFQRALQKEILELEFRRKDLKDNNRISEKDFADLLIAYAGFNTKKKSKMLRRVRKGYDEENSPGVSLVDYLNFYQVLYSINDIDTALTFYHIAGAPIERETMKHVARTVAHVDLSDHLIDVVFTLFDDNGDGKLSNKEFVSVMKQRAMRGLEKPKDMGISRILSAISKCADNSIPAIMGGIRKTE